MIIFLIALNQLQNENKQIAAITTEQNESFRLKKT